MTRTVTAAIITEVQKVKTRPVLFVELDYLAAFVRVWSGIGDITWDGKTWNGTGDLGFVSPVEEIAELGGTMAYEMINRLGPRYRRIYVGASA